MDWYFTCLLLLIQSACFYWGSWKALYGLLAKCCVKFLLVREKAANSSRSTFLFIINSSKLSSDEEEARFSGNAFFKLPSILYCIDHKLWKLIELSAAATTTTIDLSQLIHQPIDDVIDLLSYFLLRDFLLQENMEYLMRCVVFPYETAWTLSSCSSSSLNSAPFQMVDQQAN